MPETPNKPDDKPTAPETTGGGANAENDKKDLDERLDEGLEETFPSSDPVSVKITK